MINLTILKKKWCFVWNKGVILQYHSVWCHGEGLSIKW